MHPVEVRYVPTAADDGIHEVMQFARDRVLFPLLNQHTVRGIIKEIFALLESEHNCIRRENSSGFNLACLSRVLIYPFARDWSSIGGCRESRQFRSMMERVRESSGLDAQGLKGSEWYLMCALTSRYRRVLNMVTPLVEGCCDIISLASA